MGLVKEWGDMRILRTQRQIEDEDSIDGEIHWYWRALSTSNTVQKKYNRKNVLYLGRNGARYVKTGSDTRTLYLNFDVPYIKFDLPSRDVTDAYLKVYLNASTKTATVRVRIISQNIYTMEKPDFNKCYITDHQVTFSTKTSKNWYTIQLSDMINYMRTRGEQQNYGIMLYLESYSTSGKEKTLDLANGAMALYNGQSREVISPFGSESASGNVLSMFVGGQDCEVNSVHILSDGSWNTVGKRYLISGNVWGDVS